MQPILTIDLSTGVTSLLDIPLEWEREYLGGASLAARLLYEQLTPDLDPLSPQAPLLFLNGPLSGTAGPTVGRFVICGRSPQTGIWAESNCGGFWGPELRKAGFDGLWISGRAAEPVYLWVLDGHVEVRSARSLWGLETYVTQTAVKAELGPAGEGASVAVIGPAGENGVSYALILTDHGRVAGRTGMGAVMGSKNLKAVAVRGHGKVPVLDPAAYNPLRAETNRKLREDPFSVLLRQAGTAGGADYFDYLADMPKKYFHAAVFEEATRISGASIAENLLVGVSACHACVIACGRVVSLPEADGTRGPRRKGAEYETSVGFGPNLLIGDPVFVTRAGELCDRLGMDSISLSNTIGLAFWLYELGKITSQDTGGLELTWGNTAAVEALISLASRREGIGVWLAEGARSLGRHFGAEDEAVQVNGLEVAYHDPRGTSGMALSYATSPRGACHNQSDYWFVEVGNAEPALGLKMYPMRGGPEKSANVARHQDWRTINNSLVLCVFANLDPQAVVDLINAACGLDWSIEDMLRTGERAWNLKRVINHRLGLRRENDTLPKALRQPYPDGELIPNGDFAPDIDAMLQAYYVARGWDLNTGIPTPQKLASLGLGWVVEDLESNNLHELRQ